MWATSLTITCSVAFLVQIVLITLHYLNPKETITESHRQSLHTMDFPVIFRVCTHPGFNTSQLRQFGYESITEYFSGRSSFNSSIIGWGGHSEDGGTIKDPEGKN